jgi:hypothetical protein
MNEIGVFNLDGSPSGGKKVIQNEEYTFTMEFLDYEVDVDGNEIPDSETPIPFDPDDKFLFVAFHSGKEVFRLERNKGIEAIGDDFNILRFTFSQEKTSLLNPKFDIEFMVINSQDKNKYYVNGIGFTTKTLGRL